jgi:hypothetical protein
MRAFPKIFALGTDYIKDIFKHDVEVTEKVDGSQFGFGIINGQLFMRSKGAVLYAENPEKMFKEAIDYVSSVAHLLVPGVMHYAEYLKKPKHNTLAYHRIPKNHLALFGVMDMSEVFVSDYNNLTSMAERLDIDVVPLVFRGSIKSADFVLGLMERESYLGGVNIEGVVVKNYVNKFLLGGQPMPLMAGKFVSEAFKEVHRDGWKKDNTGKGKWETFQDGYRTAARWEKAVQHLRESGTLTGTPQDIGPLLKEVQRDIAEEEMEIIKNFLWKEFGQQVLRSAVRGLPEWYKERLLTESMEDVA